MGSAWVLKPGQLPEIFRYDPFWAVTDAALIDNWRAPTDVEILCVVGEHSFTGITGAAAAELCGVAP